MMETAAMADFRLARDPMGRLTLTTADGEVYAAVVPVRAFPVTAPERGIALVSQDGHELAWIDRLEQLPPDHQTIIEEELAGREFMPEILRIVSVSTFATPSTWQVETDRGETSFVLKGEDDIRRLPGSSLLISDNHGIHYLLRNLGDLDKGSRRILDRFL